MNAQILPLAVFQVAALVGALGQLLYKKGSTAKGDNRYIARLQLLLGVGLYASVTVMFATAYWLGGHVSTLYPTYGATFVWGISLPACFQMRP